MANSTDGVRFQSPGLIRTLYNNFTDAGISSFDEGTSQDPNQHLELLNVLPTADKGFRRRWGLSIVGAVGGNFAAVRTWPYNVSQDASNPANTVTLNELISTDNQNFQSMYIGGPGTNNPLQNTLQLVQSTFTNPKSFPTAGGHVYALVSRRWFYSSNGIDAPQKVYPAYTTRDTRWNWGIDSPSAFTVAGSPSAAVPTITAFGGTGTGYTHATVAFSSSTGMGATAIANILNGTITSFTVTDPGHSYTTNPIVIISGDGTNAAAVAVYTPEGAISAVLPSGYINLAEGRTYTYAWQNSITGHTSDIAKGIVGSSTNFTYSGGAYTVNSPAKGVVGNIPPGVGYSQIQVTITPVGAIDPQVDTLLLLATADGGALTKLYEVTKIPINPANPGTISYTDLLPDTLNQATLNSAVNNPAFGITPIQATFYNSNGSGTFNGVGANSPWFVNYYNSLMFNPHPTDPGPTDGYASILPGYPVSNGNQQRPFMNAVVNTDGSYQANIVVQGNGIQAGSSGTYFNFQASFTGTFYVTVPGNYTFNCYCDSSYLMAIQGANLQSGPQVFGGQTTSPLKGYSWQVGQNDNGQDWHHTAGSPFVFNFPAKGAYNFEIGFATANHDEREFSLLLNNTVFLQSQGNPFIPSYSGLTLLDGNLWADVDVYGNLLGITNNGIPQNNLLYTVLHQGRIFGTDGYSLYFSKNINEVTTSTSLITSKWEEAWPGDNQLPISADNELITALKSDGTNLHIGTTQSVYTVTGDSPGNFSAPNLLFQETGVLSHDLWSVIYSEGEPAGYCWVTPDLKILYSDFNTYIDIGVPIYNILENWDNNYNESAAMTSFTYGPYNFAVLSFKSRNNPTGEFYIYETKLRRWYHWTVPANGSGPISTFVYQHPPTGFRGLFFIDNVSGNTNYKVFDPGQTSDLGAAIAYAIQTTWLTLGSLNTLKIMNQIDILTDDTAQTVTVYGATQRSDFDNPRLIKTGPITTGPLHTYKFYLAGANSKARFYSLRFENPNSSSVAYDPTNVLDAFEIEFDPTTGV